VRDLLTAREVAKFLGLSTASVLRRWRSGELPGFRLNSNVLRFDPEDIAAYLAECKRGGRAEERATEPLDAHPGRVVSPLPPNPASQGGTTDAS
jgi:predicted DNA-binding transcriptional regulator AlpA